MSAWIVSKEHIDVVVTAVGHILYPDTCFVHNYKADTIGRILWRENLISVASRYPDDEDGERPGPIGFTDKEVDSYKWTRRDVPTSWFNSAARCLDYQSCEHEGWEASMAKQFVDLVEANFPASDNEFEKAPWGIDSESFKKLEAAQ